MNKFIIHAAKTILLFMFGAAFIISCKEKKETTVKDNTILPNSVSFIDFGDWGSQDSGERITAKAMDSFCQGHDIAFFLANGDNFYESGVQSATEMQWYYTYEKVYNTPAFQKDWYVALGNHDYKGNSQAEVDYTKRSSRWKMPSRYYTFTKKISDKTSIRFVIIDTSPFQEVYRENAKAYDNIDQQDTAKQIKWIDSVLANSKEKWKFVMGHHPLYASDTASHNNSMELRRQLQPLLEKYKVQAYFAGHKHAMEYLKLDNNDVDYFISGAAGAALDGAKKKKEKIDDMPYTKFKEYPPRHGFAVVSVNDDSMKFSFINDKDTVIYQRSRKP